MVTIKRWTCLYSIKIMSYQEQRWEWCSHRLGDVVDTYLVLSVVLMCTWLTLWLILMYPSVLMLTICSCPPPVPAHHYSIPSAVFYLMIPLKRLIWKTIKYHTLIITLFIITLFFTIITLMEDNGLAKNILRFFANVVNQLLQIITEIVNYHR